MLTKEDTKILKGISILIMIWLHTFLYKSNVDLLTCFIYLGKTPLVTLIKDFCTICIHLYLFLGGYGLYVTFKNRRLQSKRRVFFLYLNYWVMLLLMLPIGFMISPDNYPGSLTTFLLNFVAWDYSYNTSWWFLFPYILIILTAKHLFGLLDKWGGICIFIITYLVNLMTSYTISRYGDKYLYNNLVIYVPFLYFHLLNAFYTGAIFAKYDLFGFFREKVGKMQYKNWICIIAIISLIMIKGYLTTSIINIYVVSLFFVLICCIDRPLWIDKILLKLGEGSTNMWFVHAFVCIYFLHDLTYSLKYPLWAFLFVVVCSYVIHLVINAIYNRSKSFILSKWEI